MPSFDAGGNIEPAVANAGRVYDMVVISQVTPGPISVMATYVGYKVYANISGGMCGNVGAQASPSIMIMYVFKFP